MNRYLILAAIAVLAAGCGSDNEDSITGPDAPQCVKGSIEPGSSVTGEVTTASCSRFDFALSGDSVYYDAYTMDVERDHGYLVTLAPPDGAEPFDNSIELVATNPITGEEQVLGISDDEGSANSSPNQAQMRFVAPASTRLSVRVSGYDRTELGEYALTVQSCDPPAPGISAPTNITGTLASTDCVSYLYASGDSSNVQLYSIHFDANQERIITVTSPDFSPAIDLWGPGFDALCYLEGCGGDANATAGSTATIDFVASDDFINGFLRNTPGTYTLAVGSSQFGGAGSYTLHVTDPELDRVGPAKSIFHRNNSSKMGLKHPKK